MSRRLGWSRRMTRSGVTGARVTPPQEGHIDTLRRAQLGQAAESLERAAGAVRELRDARDVSRRGELGGYVRTVRADLDALDSLY